MSDELHLDPSLAYDSSMPSHATPQQNMLPSNPYQQDRITVVVDRQHFIHTRNALNNAFMSLSSAIDRAVKAYADHTDAVISGDHTLDVSGLLNPFNQITQFAQQFNPAFFPQYTNGSNGQQAPVAPMEGAAATTGKKKRAYKQRDPGAPKRPLTAYFRFLKEQRPVIAAETPEGESGKAGDISKIATERWKALTDAERNPYKQAYQHELEQYEVDTKAYKDNLANGGVAAVKLGAEDEDEEVETPSAAGPSHVVAKADDEEDEEDSDETESSEDDSDDAESDEEEAIPARAPTPPAAAKKAPKSAKKAAVTAAADPVPSQQMFSSLNPSGTPATGSKRKADDEVGEKSKKKRGRPTKAEQEAAAAASQLVAEGSGDKVKKEKKKKRKSEVVAA